MSLRMNLYGCDFDALKATIMSGDEDLLQRASGRLDEIFKDSEWARELSGKWLEKLIKHGCPLKESHDNLAVPEDGGLLVSQLEAETHVFAIHSIFESLKNDTWLNLSGPSSNYTPTAVRRLYRELDDCEFLSSDQCPEQLANCLVSISTGTPLFGDGFHTNWSYYCFLENQKLLEMQRGLEAALTHKKFIPDYVPEEVKKDYFLELSEGGRKFTNELLNWLGSLTEADQDLYIIWW